MPTAIVLDSEQRSALAVTRSLGRSGIPVINADSTLPSLASRSRFSVSSVACPDPASEPESFNSWLAQLVQNHNGLAIIACTDASLSLAVQSAAPKANIFQCVPPADSYRRLSDKWSLYQAAAMHGIPVPFTRLITSSSNLHEFPAAVTGPVVVKPRQSVMPVGGRRVKLAVCKVRDGTELDALLRCRYPDGAELLVQQAVAGHSFGVSAICDHGRPVAWFAHCRIREKPPSGGVSTVCESIALPRRHAEHCLRLIEETAWHGPVMFEFMGDPEGNAWLIEVNGRLWGSVQLAIDCGVDVPWLMYQLAVGERPEPVTSYAVGRRMRWLMGDLSHLYLMLRNPTGASRTGTRLQALADVLLKWNANQSTEDWRYADLGPFWHQFRREAAAVFSRRTGP